MTINFSNDLTEIITAYVTVNTGKNTTLQDFFLVRSVVSKARNGTTLGTISVESKITWDIPTTDYANCVDYFQPKVIELMRIVN
jgi:hypothetical protein